MITSLGGRHMPRFSTRAAVVGLSLLFGVASALYIFLSDRLVAALTSDTGRITAIQTYKGWAYICVATALVYALLNTARRLEARRIDEIERANEALREAHRALEVHKEHLEELIDARTSELRVARVEAEQLARVKSEFVANMSHEIRTPLNAVLGFAQLGMRAEANGGSRATFARILDSGQHLLGIVNDILDVSKIEAGKLLISRAPFALGDAVDRAVQLVAASAYAKAIDFNVDEAPDLPETCHGDAARLSQVLVNLLSNAVKFTPSGGSVVLRVERCAQPDTLCFRVTDTGIGMSSEDRARLFRPFQQADGSASRPFGGTGLGLAICKRLVDLMGGEIMVESTLGEGSRFEVRVPLGAEEAAPASQRAATVALSCLASADVASVKGPLEARGVGVVVLRGGHAVPPSAAMLLVAAEALEEEGVRRAAEEALDRGQRVAVQVAAMGGELPASLSGRVLLIERPLRARHVLRALAGPRSADASRGAAPRLVGVSILAAEDNEANRLVLAAMLEREGAVLCAVEDGQGALATLEQRGGGAFDVLLTDVQMPGMDGYEAARRAREIAPDLPVIGVTAHAMAEERDRCLAAGMVERVVKPIELDVLVSVVLRHVRWKKVGGAARDSIAGSTPVAPSAKGDSDSASVIDWARLEQDLGDLPGTLDRVLAAALRGHDKAPDELRAAAARKDMAALAAMAHKLKGMSGTLRAGRVFALAAEAERSARGSAEDAPKLGVELAEAMDLLIEELRGHVAPSSVHR